MTPSEPRGIDKLFCYKHVTLSESRGIPFHVFGSRPKIRLQHTP
jgi:hypothetical protein